MTWIAALLASAAGLLVVARWWLSSTLVTHRVYPRTTETFDTLRADAERRHAQRRSLSREEGRLQAWRDALHWSSRSLPPVDQRGDPSEVGETEPTTAGSLDAEVTGRWWTRGLIQTVFAHTERDAGPDTARGAPWTR